MIKNYNYYNDDEFLESIDGYISDRPISNKHSGKFTGNPIAINKLAEDQSLESWFNRQAQHVKHKEQLKTMLKHALKELNKNEKELITLYFLKNLSQDKIAKKLGLYQMEVSRKIQKIVTKLKQICNKYV